MVTPMAERRRLGPRAAAALLGVVALLALVWVGGRAAGEGAATSSAGIGRHPGEAATARVSHPVAVPAHLARRAAPVRVRPLRTEPGTTGEGVGAVDADPVRTEEPAVEPVPAAARPSRPRPRGPPVISTS
jgi:hypothetical protein